VVQWLHENRTEGCTTKAMDDAAENGHLEVVKWLHANRTEGCTTNAMDWAAMEGHLEVIQWLHHNRTEGCSRSSGLGTAEGPESGGPLAVQEPKARYPLRWLRPWLHVHFGYRWLNISSNGATRGGPVVAPKPWMAAP
jgi:hypothetical protein